MNRTIKYLVLAMSLLAPAGAFASATDSGPPAAEHGGRHHRGFLAYKMIENHAAELGIPPATVDQMKAAFESARPDFQRLRQDLEQARQSGDLTRISSAETAMLSRRQALRAQIHGLLNDQQRAAVKQMMERHRAERGQKTGG
jgi:hypothetical protein